MKANDRIIVALDVPSADDASALINELDGVVSFFKIGLELLMAGGVERILRMSAKDKQVFVDLKLPDDIPETVQRVTAVAAELGARFLTLSHSASRTTIEAAVRGRGARPRPELLYVPVLSSLGREDFARATGLDAERFHGEILEKARGARAAGVDGFVVSGREIAVVRAAFPSAPLVSPGIRPAGSPADDHKRSCTPSEAIRFGADYIVVGRPIRNASDRRAAARRIIDEVAGEEPVARADSLDTAP